MPGPAQPAAAPDVAPAGKPQYLPGQVMIKLESHVGERDATSFFARNGLTVMRHFDVPENMRESFGGSLYLVGIRRGERVVDAVARLSGQDGVAYAEPNFKIKLNDPPPTRQASTAANAAPTASLAPKAPTELVPNDLDPKLWGMRNTGQEGGHPGVDINATKAWAQNVGSGDGPLIAVIDTGIDTDHVDLSDNIWVNPREVPRNGKDDDHNGYIDDVNGANIMTGNGDVADDNGHGTHVAGTIGAVGNNGIGVVGLNWKANLAAVKFLDSNGEGSYANAVAALFYAAKIGARVTINSWGDGGYSKALEDAFRASPAFHVAAAGNSSANTDQTPMFPACYQLPNMISVAALDHKDHFAGFSNFGPHTIHLAAPGVDIYSTVPGDRYEYKSGTSMAAPHVAGVAALILTQEPMLSNRAVRDRILNTVTRGNAYSDTVITGGRLNAGAALRDDMTPPAKAADFAVTGNAATHMTMSWTEVGDDDMTGQAHHFEIRTADRPITPQPTDQSIGWNDARVAYYGKNPQPAGARESVGVWVVPSEQPKPVYFALKVYDAMGNESPLATASQIPLSARSAFRDEPSSSSNDWTMGGKWGRVQVPGRGWAYTDSPNGPYANDSDTVMVSRPISLSGLVNPRLLFDERHDTEKFYDFARVEASGDGGQTWTELARYDGTSDWSTQNLSLSAFTGRNVQLRFRMTSDATMQKDGFYVANIRILGDPA